jgi:hypothetical protein
MNTAITTLLQQYQGTVGIGEIIMAVFVFGVLVALVMELCNQEKKEIQAKTTKKFYYVSYADPKKMVAFDIK